MPIYMNGLAAQEKLRKAVIKYKETHTIQETARFFEIGTDTVSRWDSQYKNKGTLLPAETGGKTYSFVTEEGQEFLIAEIKNKNDITLEMLQQKYLERFGILISISTVHYHLKKLNISFKKKVSMTRKN